MLECVAYALAHERTADHVLQARPDAPVRPDHGVPRCDHDRWRTRWRAVPLLRAVAGYVRSATADRAVALRRVDHNQGVGR